jgi:hypothetical protein
MVPASLILPGPLVSASEWRCAVLDGELVALGDGFLPIDAPLTARERAASLAPALIDDRVVIADRSAAWVWGWAPTPPVVSTCVSIQARIPSPDRRRLRAREVVIEADELRMLGAVPVTAPLRTLLDLARHDHDAHIVSLLTAGLRAHGVTRAQLDAALARRPSLSFVRPARARLLAALDAVDAATDQPLLTR